MKDKLKSIRVAGIMTALFASVALAADPLTEAATAKAAAGKEARDQVTAANNAAKEANSQRAAGARAAYSASLELTASRKALTSKVAAAKGAAEKAAASKTDADKAAADKLAAEKMAAEKAVKDAEVKVATARNVQKEKDAAAQAATQKLTKIRRASYPVLAEKAAADKALAEKVALDRAASAKAAAQESSTAATVVKKAEAAKAEAGKHRTKCVASLAAVQKAAAGKTEAEKAAADKDVKAAKDKVAAAEKALAEKEAALKTAIQNVKTAKTAAEKATVAKSAADKDLRAKTDVDRIAVETHRGSELYVALTAADNAVKAKAAAEKVVAEKAALVAPAKSAWETAKVVSTKAAAEKATAEKALAAAPEDKKGVAKEACDAKVAAAEAAANKAASAKAAFEKAVAETESARKVVPEKAKAIAPARDKEAVARAIALGGLKPMAGSKWDYAKARHLMVRAGFGGTPTEVQKLYEMGLHKAVEHFVEIYDQPVANIEFDPSRLRRPEPWIARLDSVERQAMTVRHRNPERRQQAEMRRWWLKRMAESPRPLQEKMTLFWHDHFAVQYKKRYRTYMLYQQNQLFRTYAVDSFAGLLRGIVHDPAMISFLDNNVNFKGSGNENLGREILELFSLGEGRGYSEDDLREASRALTGYTYDSWTGQFRYLATRHDDEPKKILGSTGNWSGDDLVDIILRQPSTSRYVTEKIFAFLAYGEPETEIVEKLAHVMRYCSYDLRPMLKNLFLSEAFYSEKVMGTHIKGPVELTVGAIRDLGIRNVNYGNVDSAINQMGQYLFEPPNVAGWNENRTWINAERILIRYNQMAKLLEQPNVDLVALLEGRNAQTPQQIIDEVAKACLVVGPDAEKRKVLTDYIDDLPPVAEWKTKRDQVNARLRVILVLLMSTPESQLG
jgi:hypothetical protein